MMADEPATTPPEGAQPPARAQAPETSDLIVCAVGRRRLTKAQIQVDTVFLKFMRERYGAFPELPDAIATMVYKAEGPDEDLRLQRFDEIMSAAGFPPKIS